MPSCATLYISVQSMWWCIVCVSLHFTFDRAEVDLIWYSAVPGYTSLANRSQSLDRLSELLKLQQAAEPQIGAQRRAQKRGRGTRAAAPRWEQRGEGQPTGQAGRQQDGYLWSRASAFSGRLGKADTLVAIVKHCSRETEKGKRRGRPCLGSDTQQQQQHEPGRPARPMSTATAGGCVTQPS